MGFSPRGNVSCKSADLIRDPLEQATATNRKCPPKRTSISLTQNQLLVLPIPPNQAVRRAVMTQLRLLWTFELWDDLLSQHLAQLHAPLIERVDIPDRTL